jgi:hypothetical protein
MPSQKIQSQTRRKNAQAGFDYWALKESTETL